MIHCNPASARPVDLLPLDNTWAGENTFEEDVHFEGDAYFEGFLLGEAVGPRLDLGDPCGWRYTFDSKFVLSINDRYAQGGVSTGYWAFRDETSNLSARISAEDLTTASKTYKFPDVAGTLVVWDPTTGIDPSTDPGVKGQLILDINGNFSFHMGAGGWVSWPVNGP